MRGCRGVFVICHQAGCARAIAPVIQQLKRDRIPLQVVAAQPASAAFSALGIDARVAGTGAPSPDRWTRLAADLLRLAQPDFVLSGTSAGETLEKVVVRLARFAGIPTVAVLDQWVNYDSRFGGPDGPFQELPDVLAVMDEEARKELIRLGCPPQRLVVTGQPALEVVASMEMSALRQRARRAWDVREEDWVVVFASEAQARDYGSSLGYDESDVLRLVLGSLSGQSAYLVIKPHPTERPDHIRQRMRQTPSSVVVSIESNEMSPHEVMAGADTVMGMTSLFLLEAALAGRPVLSIQLGKVMPWTQRFPSLMTVAQDKVSITRWLSEPHHRQPRSPNDRAVAAAAAGLTGQATAQIVAVVRRIMEDHTLMSCDGQTPRLATARR